MNELPFLVVHGSIVAKLLVVVFAGAASAALWLARRCRDRARARRGVRARAQFATAPSEGIVTLCGVWCEDRDRRWLDCGGEPVELDGETRVARGVRARWRWRDAIATHRVRPGDEVLASGRLVRRADANDVTASYRQLAGRWVLVPRRVLTPIEISALAPAACPSPLGARGVLLFVGFAVAGHVSLQAVGRAALAHDGSYHSEPTMTALAPLDPAVIAAALPGTRDAALRRLDRMFDSEIIRTPATVELSIELARLRGCDAGIAALLGNGRFEEAVAHAEACGDARRQVQALLLLGRFEEAARIADRRDGWIDERTTASIGAGRWSEAAAVTDEHAALVRRAIGLTRESAPFLGYLACAADLFRFHGGDAAAAGRLRDRAQQWQSAECRVFEALALPIDQQAAALTAARTGLDADSGLAQSVDLILWTLQGELPPSEPFASSLLERRYMRSLSRYSDDREAWLAPFARTGDAPRARAWMAVHHTYAGDWKAAHAETGRHHDELTGDDWRRFDPQALDLEIQLREGASPLALDPFAEHAGFRETTASHYAALRRGVMSSRIEPHMYGMREPARAALRAAIGGDGGPLAGITERSNAPWPAAPGVALAVLPMVVHQREQLAVALGTIGFSSSPRVFGFLWSLAMRRDLARAAADPAMTSRCQAILDRYRTMLADRDKVIALLVLDPLVVR